MSELQISLLAIGALVILAVFAYNKWQERKLARSAQESFGSRHEDVLLNASAEAGSKDLTAKRTSGSQSEPAHASEARVPGDRPRIEPVMDALPRATEQAEEPAEDAILDYVIEIVFADAVPGDLITSTSELAQLPRARWEAFMLDTGRWQVIEVAGSHRRVRAALQIVSRQGAIQQRDLEMFGSAVADTAQRLGGTVSASDPAAALARARELDAFCGDVDVQIAIHLVSRDGVPFPGTKLRGLAEAAGMSLGADRQFHLRNDDGLILYSLANKEAQAFQAENMRELVTRGVSLLLDVPRTPGGTASFRAMVALAQRLAQSLDAAIIDDNGNPLGDRAFEAIAAQLTALYGSMQERGISAGSPTALRLFS
jgi:FtsZ-interacting cell division protein ZipA